MSKKYAYVKKIDRQLSVDTEWEKEHLEGNYLEIIETLSDGVIVNVENIDFSNFIIEDSSYLKEDGLKLYDIEVEIISELEYKMRKEEKKNESRVCESNRSKKSLWS